MPANSFRQYSDKRLQQVTEVWDTLPEAIKVAVLALVEASRPNGSTFDAKS